MRTSQRHLDSIKSVFGGLKNWWKGEDKKKEEPAKPPPKRESQLRSALDSAPDHMRNREHPAMRVKTDTSGFYEDDTDFASPGYGRQSGSPQQQTSKSSHQRYEDQFNADLGEIFPLEIWSSSRGLFIVSWLDFRFAEEMSLGMGRLKDLARGLGSEIEAQNDQLDRINTKVERADIKVRDQNRQMGRILK